MSAELDMSQYLDLFLQEAEEQIEILEREMLGLEKDPTDQRLQVIFRAAHTLKGSSRAMGFSRFAELTHEMENILDQLRHHTLNITRAITDGLLAGIDVLAQMTDSIKEGKGDAVEISVLIQSLQAIGSGGQVEATPEVASVASADSGTSVPADQWATLAETAAKQTVLHAKFELSQECVMKFVRAFMAISLIQESGELLVCVPDHEKLEEEEFDREFELVFSSTIGHDEVLKKLNTISEVAKIDLAAWQTPSDSASAKAPEELTVASDSPAAPVVDSASTSSDVLVAKKVETNQTVRVDVARLDSLMNLVGELVIDRTRISQLGSILAAKYPGHGVDDLQEVVSHIARITSELQDQIMKARMMPIETVFNRFPRVVRDLANKLGKEVDLQLIGGETELDRSVIEVIGDPLLHILRNSIDHGLELPEARVATGKSKVGRVTVSACHQENYIVIEIEDDGAGIDAERLKKKAIENGLHTPESAARLSEKEALNLIFHSGFSTAKEVSEVSGRGVGMDIVRSNIQKLGGLIDLETTVGKGTKTIFRLPLTLAIIRGLLVSVLENVFVLPLGSVVETLLIEPEQVQRVNHKEVIVIRGSTLPLVRLKEVFNPDLKKKSRSTDAEYVVIVGLAEQRVGLIVDHLIGEQEVVIKSLSRFLGDVKGISGATILGDGNVALIADANGILAHCGGN